MSKSSYAALSSTGVPQYTSFLRLAQKDLYGVICKANALCGLETACRLNEVGQFADIQCGANDAEELWSGGKGGVQGSVMTDMVLAHGARLPALH